MEKFSGEKGDFEGSDDMEFIGGGEDLWVLVSHPAKPAGRQGGDLVPLTKRMEIPAFAGRTPNHQSIN